MILHRIRQDIESLLVRPGLNRRAPQAPADPALRHRIAVPGAARPRGIFPPLEFDPPLAPRSAPLFDPRQTVAGKVKVATPPRPGFELEHAEIPALESVLQARVAGPKHPCHGIQKHARGQVQVLEIPRCRESPVHQGRLQTPLPRGEQIESKSVRRIHARRPVAPDIAPVVRVLPLERHVRGRRHARTVPDAARDILRILDRSPQFESTRAGHAQERHGPRHARRRTPHAADSGTGPTAASSTSRRFTSSGNRRGRPRSSAHTSQVRARASVASSSARATR